MKKKALVVDLDRTLYSINTFHYFIKYLIHYSIKKFDIILFWKVLTSIIFRITKSISQSKMKYNILKAIKDNTEIDYLTFVQSISPFKNNINIINDDSFYIKILATAAPSCYAEIIAKNEGFNVCIATDSPKKRFNKEFENIKEVKRNNVIGYLKEIDVFQVDTFVTDHLDDISLMEVSKNNILISPDSHTKAELDRIGVMFKTMTF